MDELNDKLKIKYLRYVVIGLFVICFVLLFLDVYLFVSYPEVVINKSINNACDQYVDNPDIGIVYGDYKISCKKIEGDSYLFDFRDY